MEIDAAPTRTSPPSTPSTPSQSRMHLDLSTLPPLITPSPPSNTLLITNLQDLSIFTAPTLQSIRDLIQSHAPLHSFSPLKSLRRIVASFRSTDDAIALRKLLDGSTLLGHRVRVYFGIPTPIDLKNQHLELPEAQKLFFISPPPSPPHGWTMRNEEPPNKAVHAADLATALARLSERAAVAAADIMDEEGDGLQRGVEGSPVGGTAAGATRVVYHPDAHGAGRNLPAVMVEDTTGQEVGGDSTKIMAHTARPPVELMEEMDCS